MLVDAALNLVYINAEAVQVLAYPKSPTDITALDRYLSDKIRLLLPRGKSSPPAELTFGRRQYFSRVLSVASRSDEPGQATAVLLERSGKKAVDIEQAAIEFGLSGRERETVTYLLQGLTSKQIARQMTISPYTVKTYLRLIMIKMAVSTRSGIVGKLVSGNTKP